MDKNSNYRRRALDALSGKWAFAAVATLIMFLLTGLPMTFIDWAAEGLGNVWTLAVLPLVWGYNVLFLSIARAEQADHGMMFDGYKDFVRIFLTMLLKNIYLVLWSLLLIVPGIVKSYSYSMTEFIMKDDPELKYDAAIEKSMSMMQGHKMQLFLLDLSFIGYLLLSLLTLGIGMLFLYPYLYTAHAKFYMDLKESAEEEKIEEA